MKIIGKLAAALLAAACLYAVSFSSFAAVITGGVDGINERGFAEALKTAASNGGVMLGEKKISDLKELSELSVRPGEVLTINISADMLLNDDGDPLGLPADAVSISALEDGRIQARQVVSRGEGIAVTSLDGTRTASSVKIEFSKSLAYLNESFSYSVYLAHNSSRKSATRINISGKIKTDVKSVSGGDEFEDTSGGNGVKAADNIRNFEFYLGNGVSITRNLSRGRTYYGVASNEPREEDEALYAEYRQLGDIYRLETVNLKTDGNIVRFDLDDTFYIYNTYGVYLGQSDEDLPYWTTYYLCFEKYPSLAVNRE